MKYLIRERCFSFEYADRTFVYHTHTCIQYICVCVRAFEIYRINFKRDFLKKNHKEKCLTNEIKNGKYCRHTATNQEMKTIKIKIEDSY